MFEQIVLRRAATGTPISIGEIIEALLYYQRVHIVLDRSTLFDLIHKIGLDNLLRLIQRSDVTAVYCEEMLGTHTESIGVLKVHTFVAMTLAGHQDVGALRTPEERLIYDLEKFSLEKTAIKKFVKTFFKLVPLRKFSGKHFSAEKITDSAKSDALDISYRKLAVRSVIKNIPGGYDLPETFKFDIDDSDLGLHVFHDVDLDAINLKRAAMQPPLEALTIAFILNEIQEARADLALSSFYGGDFVTSSGSSALIRLRYAELLQRTQINLAERTQFAEIVLPDSPTVSEVIDANERSLNEAFSLIDKAMRFKDWLKTVNPDEGLIRSYMKDVTSEGWIQRLPAKSLRYVITLALDSTNPITGVLAGVVDNFILEKLLNGWRPNHFINSKLDPFVNQV